MLMPRRVKHRKVMRGRMSGLAKGGHTVAFGEYGLATEEPATKKPAETRMGSGKGAPDHWVAVVKPGRILFEMAGVDHESAVEAMRLASHKLPVATRVVARDSLSEGSDGHR